MNRLPRLRLGWWGGIWAIVLMLAGPAPAAAQQGFDAGTIIFGSLTAKELPEQGSGLYWVITSDLGTAQVKIPDSALAASVQRWLAANATAHPWVLSPNLPFSLPESMARDIGDFEIRRATALFNHRPDRASTQTGVEYRLTYRRRPAAAAIASINIHVLTEGAVAAESAANTWLLGTPAPGVTAWGHAAASEIPTPADMVSVTEALRAVATDAWSIAEAAGVALGSPPKDPVFRQAENAIQLRFRPASPGLKRATGLPDPHPHFDEMSPLGTGQWQLTVSHVRVIRAVTFEVPVVPIDDHNGSQAAIAGRRERAEQRKRDIESAVTARIRAHFDVIRNSVPTNERLHNTLAALNADPMLVPDAAMWFDNAELHFVSTDRRVTFGFSATVGGGWSPEDGLYGTGTFAGDNLLRQSRANRAETETITFSGLDQVQRAGAAWQIVTANPAIPNAPSLTRTLRVEAGAAWDRDQLFGNPLDTTLSFASRQLTATYSFDVRSPLQRADGSRRGALFGSTTSVGPALVWGNVKPFEGVSAPPESIGRYFGMTLSQSATVLASPAGPKHAGVGLARATATVRGLFAPAWFDFGFHRVDVSIEGETRFGAYSSLDYLVRYRTGVVVAGGSTPVFELPRLGGFDQVRGIEQGEQIGRRIGYAQLTAGPTLAQFLTWFGRARTQASANAFSPDHLYITGFLDRGIVSTDASIGALLSPHGAIGYGAAVELQNLPLAGKRGRLSIGYGRSPDSLRHPRGILVTMLAMDLN
jgi:hypothetical protein